MAEAKKIAVRLIDEKEVACANILDSVESMFWWKGKVEKEKEVFIILKSSKDFLDKIIKTIKCLHSYSNPEIIALPIIGGSAEYLQWIDESLQISPKSK